MKKKGIAALVLSALFVCGSIPCQVSANEEGLYEKAKIATVLNNSGEEITAEAGQFSYEDLADGSIKLTAYSGTEENVEIPAEIDNKPVTVIGESCFAGSLYLKTVHVPEGVTAIEDYAFECCSYLHKVYLPESLLSIGAGAFSGCVELTLVDMQDSVESIGDGAFLECISLAYVELSKNLKELGNFAFDGCGVLTTVVFRGDDCTVIKNRTFAECAKLFSIQLPENVTSIEAYAFRNCVQLTTLSIPASVDQIGKCAFQGCEKLGSLKVNCESIEFRTFTGCGQLTYVGLGDNLKRLEDNAFSACGLDMVMLPDSIEYISDSAFADSSVTQLSLGENANYVVDNGSLYTADMKKLIAYFPSDPYTDEPETEVTVPDGVEEIGDYAFYYCQAEKIILPDSVQSVGEHSFYGAAVTELVIPDGLEIPESAIEGCYGLGYEEPVYEEEETEEETIDSLSDLPTIDEVLASYPDYANYTYLPSEEFDSWAEAYVAYNSDIVAPDYIHNHYINLYKGATLGHFIGMVAVQNHDPDQSANAADRFGEGYEDLYLMMDHGLAVEINRFKIQENMVLFSGVFPSQLRAAVGSETDPTIEDIKACAGNTFTDPIVISTTTDPLVAQGFASTMFIIFATSDSINNLGAVCIDSYSHTNEEEILMNKDACYKIIDAGTMQMNIINEFEEEVVVAEDYIILELMN